MDEGSRIRLPTAFAALIREQFDDQLYLTSLEGESLRIYPLKQWLELESRLRQLPSMHAGREKVLMRFTYYGSTVGLDRSGRIVVPQLIRESAGLTGDVSLLGYIDHMQAWDSQSLQQRLDEQPLTNEDKNLLAELGI
jgi:MraZ protein